MATKVSSRAGSKIAPKLRSRIEGQKSKLVNELAKAAQIEPDQAERVLNVLQIERLMDQMNTVETLSQDAKFREAFNIHESHTRDFQTDFTIEKLSLKNLRIGVLNTKISGQSIMV